MARNITTTSGASDEDWPNIGDSCCGSCSGAACYEDSLDWCSLVSAQSLGVTK